MTKKQRAKLIKQYAAGYDEVLRALEGFPAGKLTARPFRGKWTAAEIVHHLADSEMTSAIRLRRLLAEERPVIHGYDQDAFAARLRYNERDIVPALEAFRAARTTSVQLLDAMTASDWARQAWHTDGGAYGPERWLQIYAVHAHNHAAQIVRLRTAVTARVGARKGKSGSGR
ncbi:MAG: DinB family protein [Acidobacteriia bacterium]|nr:DinB family protein [Terriglobia bacterium]